MCIVLQYSLYVCKLGKHWNNTRGSSLDSIEYFNALNECKADTAPRNYHKLVWIKTEYCIYPEMIPKIIFV